MGEQEREIQVSLREMARRRDGWKRKYEELYAEWRTSQHELTKTLVKLLEAERVAAEARENLLIMRSVKDAAQTEARRYAEECGRLRDEITRLTETK